ncbi:MAG: PilZ domain-containing protein [Bryobacterales bacterium]|nr:PilZ domain-containing protein [Bryobacterales bacterium]
MDAFRQTLDTLSAQVRVEPWIPAAVAAACCAALVVWLAILAAPRLRPARRWQRRVVGSPVRIAWQEPAGPKESQAGYLRDISAGGIGVVLPFRLPRSTRLRFTVHGGKLSGSGVVRRCMRIGPRYLIGVRYDPLTHSLLRAH